MTGKNRIMIYGFKAFRQELAEGVGRSLINAQIAAPLPRQHRKHDCRNVGAACSLEGPPLPPA
jgi:hypothetical protein